MSIAEQQQDSPAADETGFSRAWAAAVTAEHQAQAEQTRLLRQWIDQGGTADRAAEITGLSRRTLFRRLRG